jgi:hypothetical protein
MPLLASEGTVTGPAEVIMEWPRHSATQTVLVFSPPSFVT